MGRRGLFRSAFRTPTGALALATVVLLIVLAIVAPMIWGDKATTPNVDHLLEGGSAEHPLGTDNIGRDLLARTLVATRLSLVLAVLTVLVGAGIGVPLGALPTVLGRRSARLTAAVTDLALAYPALLLAIFLGIILGAGPTAAVVALGIASAPAFARLTQTLAASVAGSDYVAAAHVLGLSRRRVLFRHVLPNIAEPIILNVTVAIGYALLALSGLSFLGLGVQPPSYDWGQLLTASLNRIYVVPEAALGPCVAIVIAGLAFNGLGEALARASSTRSTYVRTPMRGTTSAFEPILPVADELRVADDPVLVVEGLTVTFPTADRSIAPVRGISFSIGNGERVAIVGESGSGKSLTALSLAQLVPHPGTVRADRLEFLGRNLSDGTDPDGVVGTSMAMVFQDTSTSLNPALRVGTQLAEVAEVHGGLRRAEARRRAVDRLREVRLSGPERRLRQFPHELSGGMRQRVMIAVGLMGEPRLIVADEPTSALDVTVQQQILRLLKDIGDDTGASCLLITHDIAVATEMCDRILVMYAGRIVEDIDASRLWEGPTHPYTRALLAAVPDMDTDRDVELASIPGRPPDPADLPAGCAFAPRCAFATDKCREDAPPLLLDKTDSHRVACWHPQQGSVVAHEDDRLESE
ncbi:MAG TPA: dipeptide/oligopeptide/nickel ABC transporter permease/ATP-binding protein, partial [Nocardioidaceae bacterium]|nr:dipeptide/oligopeptide/nickel ABC transporter permease/ATP-binding protein [Nocardioidaceae bacterium]